MLHLSLKFEFSDLGCGKAGRVNFLFTQAVDKLDRNNSEFSHGEQQCASTLTEPEKEQWELIYILNYLFSLQERISII